MQGDTLAEKLAYLNESKEEIKKALQSIGSDVNDTTLFNDYDTKILEIHTELLSVNKTLDVAINGGTLSTVTTPKYIDTYNYALDLVKLKTNLANILATKQLIVENTMSLDTLINLVNSVDTTMDSYALSKSY